MHKELSIYLLSDRGGRYRRHPLGWPCSETFHLAVVHPGVGSRAAVRKESHSMHTLYLRFFFCRGWSLPPFQSRCTRLNIS